jgi:hypothetical protein
MYIESKAKGLNGPARIGRVAFNRTGRTLSYKGKSFQSLKGRGFKANYRETETGEEYWISGPRRDGLDRLYGKSALVVEIDTGRKSASNPNRRASPIPSGSPYQGF